MITVDLITGFLGAGKTTFIRHYVKYLLSRGERICILENDFGAVNVDVMLLQDLLSESCAMEMVAGGCDADCHRRRFKTKLIAMGMAGYDRVIVEPSGIFDMDEFFDTLHEEPLDRWYRVGSVVAIVDGKLPDTLSALSDYVLATEAAGAGKLVFSHGGEVTEKEVERVLSHVNTALNTAYCPRVIGRDEVLVKDWDSYSDADYEEILSCGYRVEDYRKKHVTEEKLFSTEYFMNMGIGLSDVKAALPEIFSDPSCGRVFRIKGYVREEEEQRKEDPDGKKDYDGKSGENTKWYEVNATTESVSVQQAEKGQEVLIVIGEELNREAILGKTEG